MRMTRPLALIALLSAAPIALQAQEPAPHPGGHGQHHGPMQAGRMDPFARLLEKRQELGLTAQQVSQIEAIRTRLQAQNQPLMEQMQAARRQAGLPERAADARGGERPRLTEEQRTAMRQMRDRMAPLHEQVRTNTRAAMEQVHGLLTEQQRTQVRQWHREQRGGARGRRGGRGQHGRHRDGMRQAPRGS